MNVEVIADVIALACLFAGSILCLTAAIGVVRLPDYLSRLHAATKPQTLGVLLMLVGVGLRLQSVLDVGMLILVGVFQLLTTPAAGHMTSRGFYRKAGKELTNDAKEHA